MFLYILALPNIVLIDVVIVLRKLYIVLKYGICFRRRSELQKSLSELNERLQNEELVKIPPTVITPTRAPTRLIYVPEPVFPLLSPASYLSLLRTPRVRFNLMHYLDEANVRAIPYCLSAWKVNLFQP